MNAIDWPTAAVVMTAIVGVGGLLFPIVKYLIDKKRDDIVPVQTESQDLAIVKTEIVSLKESKKIFEEDVKNDFKKLDELIRSLNDARKRDIEKLEQKIEKLFEKLLEWMTQKK